MPTKSERQIDELYGHDPERADAVVFGRRTNVSRRGFLGGSGLAAMGAAVGAPIVFSDAMPAGLIPAALAQEQEQNAVRPRPHLQPAAFGQAEAGRVAANLQDDSGKGRHAECRLRYP